MGMRAPAPKKKPRQGKAPQEDFVDAAGFDDFDDDFPDPYDVDEPDTLDFASEGFDGGGGGFDDCGFDDGGFDDGGFDGGAFDEPPDGCGLGADDDVPDADAPFSGVHGRGVSVSGTAPRSPTQGWYCALLDRYVGRAVPVPDWYMRQESNAVHAGVQQASTCGLHAVNHALRPLGAVISWEEFEGRCRPDEGGPSGDWEFAALHRNVMAAGAPRALSPVLPDDYADLARWNPEQATLALWTADALGCVMHVPGHWVALTRPDGPQTPACVALLCDSLYRQPFALGVEEVGELFARIAAYQGHAAQGAAGMWSLNVVT